MKAFVRHRLSLSKCDRQLKAFEKMLADKAELRESEDILPFFRANTELASLIGTYAPEIAHPDLIAYEYDLFGDFSCDLAIGDSQSRTFLLVEFEDGCRNSLFIKRRSRSTPEWSSRLERGVSQVIDWFHRLDDSERTDQYFHRFGTGRAAIHGIVIVGRDEYLQEREKRRLAWRQDHTTVNSKRISIVTFDQLGRHLRHRLAVYRDIGRR